LLLDQFWRNRSPLEPEKKKKKEKSEGAAAKNPRESLGFTPWEVDKPLQPWNLVPLHLAQRYAHARDRLVCSEEERRGIVETLERIRVHFGPLPRGALPPRADPPEGEASTTSEEQQAC
jgi:hypothetical protein